ncbi:MAG: hypothetical protein IPK79_00835 [Vampirovibrionales bacterium]|nr:hypothetical protein [Vampirovibrionales bacterium]
MMKISWVTLILIALVLAGCGRQPTDDSKIVRLEPEDAYTLFVDQYVEHMREMDFTFMCEPFRDGVAVPKERGDNRVFIFDFQCDATYDGGKMVTSYRITSIATVKADHTWYIREINIE